MNWFESLKIAIIERDVPKMWELTKTLPPFGSVGDMRIAADLILEAKSIVEGERAKLLKSINDIKKAKNFLLQDGQSRRLDTVF